MELASIVQTCAQGISAKRLAERAGVKKCKVNAMLYADHRFVKNERSPLSHVDTQVVWTWSEKPAVRPKNRTRINSRNKTLKKIAQKELQEKMSRAHLTT
jgi:hypothetical protein